MEITSKDFRRLTAWPLLLAVSILAAPISGFAQLMQADDYFHQGAQDYIFGEKEKASDSRCYRPPVVSERPKIDCRGQIAGEERATTSNKTNPRIQQIRIRKKQDKQDQQKNSQNQNQKQQQQQQAQNDQQKQDEQKKQQQEQQAKQDQQKKEQEAQANKSDERQPGGRNQPGRHDDGANDATGGPPTSRRATR